MQTQRLNLSYQLMRLPAPACVSTAQQRLGAAHAAALPPEYVEHVDSSLPRQAEDPLVAEPPGCM